MRYMYVLIVMTAMVFVAAGSARGVTSARTPMLGNSAVAASGPAFLPAVKGEESLSKTIFPAAPNSAVSSVLAMASAEDDKDNKDNKDKEHQPPPPPPPPPPPSKSCPHGPPNDNTPHGNCGEGNDGKLP